MELDLFNIKLTKKEATFLNPLVLAYVGDSVYELIIRTYLVKNNMDMNVHKLHLKGIGYVKAKAQSDFMKVLLDELNEEELAIFKRGRNTKSYTVPKNADLTDYKMATGFEALIGYLYLIDDISRIEELLKKVIV
ncbi:Mini-ribonuclease 3 [Hathewaya massiliensis]|uniref:Mini-ribonuclease 3 n=1 Tax=Hathewaya massiliensis TaxID=1964382 RepID=UPI001157D35A|nr:ribonuclease III domain-containing protein [Hathewaya massiliensis]